MNCIVVDDEPLARKEMEALINEVCDLEILGSFSNAFTAKEFLEQNQVDLVFLDIEMPFFTGLEFAAVIPRTTLVIFTTAYVHYAYESYDVDAVDYLLKPVNKSRLIKAINKATSIAQLQQQPTRDSFSQDNQDFIWIKSQRRNFKVNLNQILFIEGLKDYVVIHTLESKLITALNLKTIHKKLNKALFLRVSKSYIVNTNHIDSFNNHSLFINKVEIPLGEVYKKDFFLAYYK
ncbi:LytR/AlgR family response regulator transcription factor [Myroides sp. LJL110]